LAEGVAWIIGDDVTGDDAIAANDA